MRTRWPTPRQRPPACVHPHQPSPVTRRCRCSSCDRFPAQGQRRATGVRGDVPGKASAHTRAQTMKGTPTPHCGGDSSPTQRTRASSTGSAGTAIAASASTISGLGGRAITAGPTMRRPARPAHLTVRTRTEVVDALHQLDGRTRPASCRRNRFAVVRARLSVERRPGSTPPSRSVPTSTPEPRHSTRSRSALQGLRRVKRADVNPPFDAPTTSIPTASAESPRATRWLLPVLLPGGPSCGPSGRHQASPSCCVCPAQWQFLV